MASSVDRPGVEPQGNRLAVPTETDANPALVVDHVELWEQAMARAGVSRQRMASLLRVSEAQASKMFSRHFEDQNVVMKRLSIGRIDRDADDARLLEALNREYAALLAERVGLKEGRAHEQVRKVKNLIAAAVAMLEVPA